MNIMSLVGRAARLASFAFVFTTIGCSSYSWRPSVPETYRTVSVPTFRNESDVTELGSVMTTQVLREFQREGTFKIRREGDAALEVQGIVKQAGSASGGYDRRAGLRLRLMTFRLPCRCPSLTSATERSWSTTEPTRPQQPLPPARTWRPPSAMPPVGWRKIWLARSSTTSRI